MPDPIAQGATPQPRLQALQRLFFGRANQFSTQSFRDRADTLAQITRDNGNGNAADIFELARDHADEIDLLDGIRDGFVTPQNLATLAGRGRLGTSTPDIDVSDFIRMPTVPPAVPEQLLDQFRPLGPR